MSTWIDDNFRDVDAEAFTDFNLRRVTALEKSLAEARVDATLSLELGGRVACAISFEEHLRNR